MNSKADEWLDFMQCQRQFWPTMTIRHASLAPIELGTFRRERRLMQSKHLWALTASKKKLLPDVRDTDVEMADISSVPQQTDHSESACAW